MAARLGFASAIFTEPEILLIDEVLAVGDMKFRSKCYRKLAQLRKKGTTFVLVSHNPHSILSICETAIFLVRGELTLRGESDRVMQEYERSLYFEENVLDSSMELSQKTSEESLGVDIISICFEDSLGNKIDSPVCGEASTLCVFCKAHKSIENLGLAILLREIMGEQNIVLNLSAFADRKEFDINEGFWKKRHVVFCSVGGKRASGAFLVPG
jgi:lipopolysaccharide transport system ATP-binding protein